MMLAYKKLQTNINFNATFPVTTAPILILFDTHIRLHKNRLITSENSSYEHKQFINTIIAF